MNVVSSAVNPTVESKHPWDGRLSSAAFDALIRRVATTRAKEDIDFMMYIRSGSYGRGLEVEEKVALGAGMFRLGLFWSSR
jgi:hypothetical protein